MRKRVLSGMRPSGKLHLGHYLGVLANWKKLQEDHDCFYFVADWHALTTEYENTGVIGESIDDMIVDWMAAGIDPEKATLFVQSRLPEHAELHLLLSMITPLSWLERNPTYKEQLRVQATRDLRTYGFLGYPVLQAADILMYDASLVPVGIDQVPHLELTREIARRFNFLYGETFTVPEAYLTETPKLMGTDNRKMSKSYGNAIDLFLDEKALRKQVMRIVTDPTPVEEPKDPDTCNVFQIYRLFLDKDQEQALRKRYLAGGLGYGEVKEELFVVIRDFFAPYAERRRELLADPDGIRAILARGSEKARYVATKTMRKVRKKAGLAY